MGPLIQQYWLSNSMFMGRETKFLKSLKRLYHNKANIALISRRTYLTSFRHP